MFGAWRYTLALLVVWGHLKPGMFGIPNWSGIYAVWGFFCLSGYLMTRVLHETYGFRPEGIGRYLSNRALRIYPAYWLALLVATIAIVSWPDSLARTARVNGVLPDLRGWILNIGIIGLDANEHPRLVSPAWSLHIELCFYLAMTLLSRSRTIVALWFVVSIGATAWLLADGAGLGLRYGSLLGASLPFSLGAALYSFGPRRAPPPWVGLVLVLAFFAHLFGASTLWDEVRGAGLYVSLALTGLVVVALGNVRAPSWDAWLGNLSYPIFLLHLPVAHCTAAFFELQPAFGVSFFLLCALPIHMAALVSRYAVESPTERLRRRIRKREANP